MLKGFLLKLFGFIVISLRIGGAMMSDGSHTVSDYQRFSTESSTFQSACYIADDKFHISQTGVLIAPTIIATAAHGIVTMCQKRGLNIDTLPLAIQGVKVTFVKDDKIFTYEVDSVLVDARYTENSGFQAKYDIALMKVKEPVCEITPAKIFEEETVPNQAVLTVVTFGMADLPNQPAIKRAFRLYERDTYHSGGLDDEELTLNRTTLQSSLFFKPDEQLQPPLPSADEKTQRLYEATQNWIKDGKRPYALALPGTSGAPVFIKINVQGIMQEFLFGLVTSFAHLSGNFQTFKGSAEDDYILRHPKTAFNQYQTIFALLYRENADPLTYNPNSTLYHLDPTFAKLLQRIQKD